MKLLLPLALLLLWAAAPQCEVRPPRPDAGPDSGRKDGGGGVGDGGGGGEDDGGDWDPNLPDGGFPGSGKNGDPGTDVLFLVRVDRGLANDAALYQGLVEQVRGALGAAGLRVLQVGVAGLQDGRLLWGRGRSVQPPVALGEVLAYYAERSPDQVASCSTAGLVQLGSNLPFALLTYPQDLTGVPWFEQPFYVRPGALLVVLIDHDIRPATPGDSACQVLGMTPADWFGGGAYPQWLAYRLPRPATRFWAIATPEGGLSQDSLRASCLATGFPPTALDVIAASPVGFYEPWAAGMNAQYPDLMTRADFCPSMMGNLPARTLADAWVKVLRAQVGLPP